MTSTAAAARVAPVRALGRAAISRGSSRGFGVSAFSNNAERAAFARRAVAPAPARRASSLRINAAAEKPAASAEGDANLMVSVDGSSDPAQTIISVRATNRPGLLQQMNSTLEDLGLNVEKTEVDMDGDLTNDTFYVTDDNGSRVDDPYDLANIEQVITVVLNAHFLKSSGAPRPADKDPTNLMPDGSKPKQKDLLYSLMDNYIKNDTLSVQNSIVNHVEYTLARSRYRFDDFEAYQVRRPSSILPLHPVGVSFSPFLHVTGGRVARADPDCLFPRPAKGHVAFRPRSSDRELERHPAVLPRAGPQAGLLPLHGVPDGSVADQLAA